MIKCERNSKGETSIEAKGDAMTVAADCCEIISAIRQRVRRHRSQRRRERLRRDADRLQSALHGMPEDGMYVLRVWGAPRKRRQPL